MTPPAVGDLLLCQAPGAADLGEALPDDLGKRIIYPVRCLTGTLR